MEPKGFVGGRKSLSGPKQLQKGSDYAKHHGFLEGFITTCTLLRMALWEDWGGGGGYLGTVQQLAASGIIHRGSPRDTQETTTWISLLPLL